MTSTSERQRHLLRNRNFARLLVAQTVNTFGDWALVIVLALWAKQLTGSDSAAGLVFLLFAVPALMAPVTGLLVDRVPRRRLMITNDLLAAVLVSSLFAVSGRHDVVIIYAVALGYGASGQIYQAARGGLIHSMLPSDDLGEANGLLSSMQQSLRILGPLVGAVLFTRFGGAAVSALDSVTFVFSAILLGTLRLHPGGSRTAPQPASLLPELLTGFRHILGSPELRRIMGTAITVLSLAGLLNVAAFALVDHGLHRPPGFVGLLVAIQGMGAMVGGLVSGALMRRLGELPAAGAGLAALGAGVALLAIPAVPFSALGIMVAGCGLQVFLVAQTTLLQLRTPGEFQGRVLAASEAIAGLPYTLSIGMGAIVIAAVDYRLIYLSNAVVMATSAVFLLTFHHQKSTVTKRARATARS